MERSALARAAESNRLGRPGGWRNPDGGRGGFILVALPLAAQFFPGELERAAPPDLSLAGAGPLGGAGRRGAGMASGLRSHLPPRSAPTLQARSRPECRGLLPRPGLPASWLIVDQRPGRERTILPGVSLGTARTTDAAGMPFRVEPPNCGTGQADALAEGAVWLCGIGWIGSLRHQAKSWPRPVYH